MAKRREAAGGYLWITQMADDDNDRQVCTIAYVNAGDAESTFHHAQRVFQNAEQGAPAWAEGDVLVTLKDAAGDLTVDSPLRIPASQADWFLDTWLKVPHAWREDLKQAT